MDNKTTDRQALVGAVILLVFVAFILWSCAARPAAAACANVSGSGRVIVVSCGMTGCYASVRTTIQGQTIYDIMRVQRGTRPGDVIQFAGSWCGGDDLQARQR